MKKIILILLLSGCANTLPYMSPSHVAYAEQYIGYNETDADHSLTESLGINPVETQWCGAFVSYVLSSVGKPTSDKPLWSRSYLDWGSEVDNPRVGDVVVFQTEGSTWRGHVGFYIHETADMILVLGGNQDDEVGYKLYAKSNLLGIRRLPS